VLGDEDAFREFHARYFDPLYHFLLIVARGDAHAAQEALQETLLRVARRAREFDDEAAFWDWLKVVARNVARDGGRKRRRYLALLDRFGFARDRIDTTPAGETDLRGLLDEAMAELAPDDRALLEGKYLRGATVLELAAETKATEKAVESKLSRVRRDLAERLRKKMSRS
jgi:RNA polymerase sigma-70 factor (ECF subfamily)